MTFHLHKTFSWALAAVLIGSAFSLSAQVPQPNYKCKDKICQGYAGMIFSVPELYNILAEWNGDVLTFKDCKFNNLEDINESDNFLWMLDDYTDNSFNSYADLVPDQLIEYELNFDRCEFEPKGNTSIVFQKFHFKKELSINNSTGYGLEFRRCVFQNRLLANDVRTRYLDVSSCHFFSLVYFNDINVISSTIRDSWFMNDPYGGFGIQFDNHNDIRYLNIVRDEFVNQLIPAAAPTSRTLLKNEILYFQNFQTDALTITDCNFKCTPVFRDFSVRESFVFQQNVLQGKIVFDGSPDIPIAGSKIPFSELENKMGHLVEATASEYRFMDYKKESDFKKGESNRPWLELDIEKDIVPAYSKLLAIYDATSDKESYNDCFKSLKQIEQMAADFKYGITGQRKDWFEWKMDEFLENFSAYGTDPVLTLIKCAEWMGIFCLIYMVFPSEEDNLKYHNIQLALHRYIDHFSYGKKHFYTTDELFKQELVELNAFKRNLVKNRQELPPVISFFGQPFFMTSLWLARFRHRIRTIIRFNIYQDWTSLGKRGRWKMTGYISLSLVGFLIWGLVMRIVNAITLSMNAFVTLGYGEISAKGVARYLCVLEGLMGWFFLSIFSVALISQILQ